MFMFFDTETTGLPVWKSPSDDPAQPHLVQLALITMKDHLTEISRSSVIIRPDGWTIPEETVAIHGITQERAMDEGIPEADAVEQYLEAVRAASLRVAFNVAFDTRIMRIAMLRKGILRDEIERLEAMPSACTMRASTPVLMLPPSDKMMAAGFKNFKQPTLAEALMGVCGEELDGAHDALIDCWACARVFWSLRARGVSIGA